MSFLKLNMLFSLGSVSARSFAVTGKCQSASYPTSAKPFASLRRAPFLCVVCSLPRACCTIEVVGCVCVKKCRHALCLAEQHVFCRGDRGEFLYFAHTDWLYDIEPGKLKVINFQAPRAIGQSSANNCTTILWRKRLTPSQLFSRPALTAKQPSHNCDTQN